LSIADQQPTGQVVLARVAGRCIGRKVAARSECRTNDELGRVGKMYAKFVNVWCLFELTTFVKLQHSNERKNKSQKVEKNRKSLNGRKKSICVYNLIKFTAQAQDENFISILRR
jgi:hypothetical protein